MNNEDDYYSDEEIIIRRKKFESSDSSEEEVRVRKIKNFKPKTPENSTNTTPRKSPRKNLGQPPTRFVEEDLIPDFETPPSKKSNSHSTKGNIHKPCRLFGLISKHFSPFLLNFCFNFGPFSVFLAESRL